MANYDVELNTQTSLVQKNVFFILFLAPYARTTRYEEAFLPEGKKRPRSLRSLGLASLLILSLAGWHGDLFSRHASPLEGAAFSCGGRRNNRERRKLAGPTRRAGYITVACRKPTHPHRTA